MARQRKRGGGNRGRGMTNLSGVDGMQALYKEGGQGAGRPPGRREYPSAGPSPLGTHPPPAGHRGKKVKMRLAPRCSASTVVECWGVWGVEHVCVLCVGRGGKSW